MKVKRPHMVPKGYIRAWADRRNRVEVIDVQHGRGVTSSIENATVVSYVYEPAVLTHDLEAEFALIESRGLSAIRKMRYAHITTFEERDALIAFLDMHLERGRYADQADVRTFARLLRTDAQTEDSELALGDRLLLSRHARELPDWQGSDSSDGRGTSDRRYTSSLATAPFSSGIQRLVPIYPRSPSRSHRLSCS